MATPYALILAGGSGTRFWPLSRDSKPKQLLKLFGEDTLLEQTIDRLDGLIPPENILILTNEVQLEGVRAIASKLPADNIIAEPAKRDTAPAIALGTALIAARDPEACMLVLPADQRIDDVASFQSVLASAITTAQQQDALVTIGIKPTWPCPSYGYIERGEALATSSTEHTPYHVSRFREKPAPKLAQTFLDAGNFAWNAGMFIWSIPTVTRELELHTPALATFIGQMQATDDHAQVIANHFSTLPAISIDYALMEQSSKVLNIEANFDWDDVGSWISIAKYLESTDNNSKTNTPTCEVESNHNIVFSDDSQTQVALLGVSDVIVVNTADAVLVAHRDKADDIKKIVAQLPQKLRD